MPHAGVSCLRGNGFRLSPLEIGQRKLHAVKLSEVNYKDRTMQIQVFPTKDEMGQKAADDGAVAIREAISARGSANVIVATGASQFELLAALSQQADI
ncbi:MAG: hypothetical protein ACI9G1_001974, partial [Pirellulaceae bacterium]